MKQSRLAFTMVELIFVILILGILAAVAVPKFNKTALEAQIANARAEIASIRSGIVSERQTRLITGDATFIAAGNGAGQIDAGNGLFGGVLMYPINDGCWGNVDRTLAPASSTYDCTIDGTAVTFTYFRVDGNFTCPRTTGTAAEQQLCQDLVD